MLPKRRGRESCLLTIVKAILIPGGGLATVFLRGA
jgi:hypothetical protein